MRRLEKFAVYAFACLYSCASYSQAVIPGTPSVVIGGDDVRGRDGTTCKQGTFAKPTLDFGVALANGGGNSQNNSPQGVGTNSVSQATTNSNSSYGVYARIVIPLGADPKRIDCTQLYTLEIERLRAELERLKSTGSAAVQVQ